MENSSHDGVTPSRDTHSVKASIADVPALPRKRKAWWLLWAVSGAVFGAWLGDLIASRVGDVLGAITGAIVFLLIRELPPSTRQKRED